MSSNNDHELPPQGPQSDALSDEDLIAGLALDALDDPAQEARAHELVRTDPAAARQLQDYREVAGQLAASAALAPPPQLKALVMAQLGAPAAPIQAQERFATGPRRTARSWLLAAAAAAVIAIAVPSVIAVNQHQELLAARSDAQALNQVLSAEGLRMVEGTLSTGSGRISVATSRAGAVVIASDLPRLSPESTYQLWTIGADKTPRSAGLVGADTERVSVAALAPGTTVALTIEPSGGSEQPTTQPVVAVSV